MPRFFRRVSGPILPWVVPLLVAAGCMEAFDVPDADSAGGRAYVRRCSLCHALPDPGRMQFSQWVPVVERMHRIIRSQNVPQMPEVEMNQILIYLKQHAKPQGQ